MSEREQSEVAAANESGRRPVVFVHGLWMLADSWDRWRSWFAQRGYATVAPGWPGDPETVTEARAHPEVFAGTSVGRITAHHAAIIGQLTRPAIVIGHSFGGLVTQQLAGRGLAAGAVAIDPAPFRGVLPLPLSALRASFPVLRDPRNRNRAVALTFDQFRFAFANAVPEPEARELFDRYPVAGSGRPLFQAATANLNPASETRVDTHNAGRGPLLIISGEKDNTVPRRIAHASYARYLRSRAITEFVEVPGRGHSLVIDHGWREVADTAISFLARHDLAA